MMLAQFRPLINRPPRRDNEARLSGMIEHLRSKVLGERHIAEKLHVLFLDAGRSRIGEGAFGMGSVDTLILRMREVFERALSLKASAMVLAHNHPSGICRPSRADIAATSQLCTIGSALEIELVDHLIFTRESVYSMRAGGHL